MFSGIKNVTLNDFKTHNFSVSVNMSFCLKNITHTQNFPNLNANLCSYLIKLVSVWTAAEERGCITMVYIIIYGIIQKHSKQISLLICSMLYC